jgi:hypothetical protein
MAYGLEGRRQMPVLARKILMNKKNVHVILLAQIVARLTAQDWKALDPGQP